MEKDYVPSPFPEHLMDDHEWIHVLAALDTCTIRNGPQFCNDEDKEVIPIRMVSLVHKPKQASDAITQSVLCKVKEPKTVTNPSCSDDPNDNVCPFRIPVTMTTQKSSHTVHASVNSQEAVNILSWEMWDALGQPALSSRILNL